MQQTHVRTPRDTSSAPLLGAAKAQRLTVPSVRGGGSRSPTVPQGWRQRARMPPSTPLKSYIEWILTVLFQVKVTEARFLLKESGSMEAGEAAKPISANQACSANLMMSKGQSLWCLSGDPLTGPPSHLCPDPSSCQCKQSPAQGRQRDHSRVISIITIMLQKRDRSGLPRG